MNTNITQVDIAEFRTSQSDDNIITAQVQIPAMGKLIGVNESANKNYISVTGLGSSNFVYIQYEDDGRISRIGIKKICTKNCHVFSNNPTKHYGELLFNSTIDINSHSKNHFWVRTFR